MIIIIIIYRTYFLIFFYYLKPGDDGILDPGTAMRYKPLPIPVRLGCMSTGQITVAGITNADPILMVMTYVPFFLFFF